MNLIKAFIDGNFHDFCTMEEINQIKKKCYDMASVKQKELQADHMIYCHYDLLDGNIKIAWFYTGYAMSDCEFERVETMKNVYIGAIHRHQ